MAKIVWQVGIERGGKEKGRHSADADERGVLSRDQEAFQTYESSYSAEV